MPFLLIEDLAGFKLLNSPFRCATLCVCLIALRISCLNDSLCDRKRATSYQCEWRIISHLSGAESVSWNEPGTVWVNTEQMVWSLSKTNTWCLCFLHRRRKQGPLWCVIHSLFGFTFFGPNESGCCFLWPDSCIICHHLAPLLVSLHIHYCFLVQPPTSVPPSLPLSFAVLFP